VGKNLKVLGRYVTQISFFLLDFFIFFLIFYFILCILLFFCVLFSFSLAERYAPRDWLFMGTNQSTSRQTQKSNFQIRQFAPWDSFHNRQVAKRAAAARNC
jgi:hypothetical protein